MSEGTRRGVERPRTDAKCRFGGQSNSPTSPCSSDDSPPAKIPKKFIIATNYKQPDFYEGLFPNNLTCMVGWSRRDRRIILADHILART